MRYRSLLILGFVALPVAAQDAAVPPLFASNETIEITLRADFDELKGDRGDDSEDRDAIIEWASWDGTSGSMGMKLRTRGNFRLKRSTCPMPPLRMDFKKDSLSATPFADQNKLKLVTFCRDRDRYEQNVLKEYLAYRGYNLITENSFRVRLAMVTYEDTSGKNDTVTRYGFMIEDEVAMAERLGGRFLDVPQAHPTDMDAKASTVMALYQYLIGNTDFSASYFHNTKLVRLQASLHVTIPYDFDWAGMVNAPYAKPDPILGTRSVVQRVYRGYCREGVEMEPLYQQFREHRAPFEALIGQQPGLDEGAMEDVIDYLDDFYDMLDNPGKLRRNIERACMKWE
jgi:hypothetical protein